jgi:tetratricopeptide (TPR) repeat protein
VADDSRSPRADNGADSTQTNVGPGSKDLEREGFSLAPAFSPGQVLAGRYEVERFLARGGMGEVYQVRDRELGESVALKTILPRSANDPVSLDRFRREINIARQVSHRNVCRIFDLGRHVRPNGEEVVFLTMELLRGVSLRARLSDGVMTSDEAFGVVEQLSEGLAAAHRKGIVHRDLKPSNVFLVPEGSETRVVITDFGLARTEIKEEGQLTVTGTGEILGTPAYMSPEQIEGKKATTASDIYSLGLVMYEMLTGAQPFEGESAFQIALNKLREAPTNPSTRVEGLPILWDRTILRCLEKEPEDRFASVSQIPAVLSGERRLKKRPFRSLSKRPAVWVSVAVMVPLAVATFLLFVFGFLGGPGDGRDATGVRRSVAVLGFENNRPDEEAAWIATALGEYLTTELASGGALRAVPGQSVADARAALEIDKVTTLAPETLSRLRELLAVDLVVLGSYTLQGAGDDAPLRLDYRVQDVDSPEPIVIAQISGLQSELFEIAAGAAGEIRARLGLDVIAGSAASEAFPSDPDASRLYAEGVMRLRSFDPAGARDRLERAAAVEPQSPLIWIELSNAWSQLGYGVNALGAARRSSELSEGLERELRLRIEGQYQLLAGRMDEAVDTFRSLWLVYPDNLEYGISLAEAQVAAGEAEASLDTVAELRTMPEPMNRDPRIDLAEALAAAQAGDVTRQVAAAERVVETSGRVGSSLLEAEARLALGNALRDLGELDRSLSELQSARRLQVDSGNRAGVAASSYSVALTHLAKGEIDDGTREAEVALATAREVEAKIIEGDALNLIGSIRVHEGDYASALEVFTSALELQRDIGNSSGEADAFNNLALVQMWSGDFVRAVDSFAEVRARYRDLGKPQMEAAVVMNLARMDAVRGDLDSARGLFEEAAGIYRAQSSGAELAEALYGLGEVLLTQGDLDGARARHEEALSLRRDHELGSAAVSEFALAGLTLSEAALGRRSYEDAVSELSRSVATLGEEGRPALEADALNYLAEAQLGAGRSDEAAATLERLRGLSSSANSVTLMVLRINEARLAASRGRQGDATSQLRDVLDDARTQSSYGVELEARLAMAEVAAGAGRVEEAGRLVTEIRRDATARGWILVADKAAVVGATLPGR